MENIVRIFDTTLRDGEQSPGCSMNIEEKVTMARQLEKLGVDVIEAGFPIASQGDFEAVKRVAEAIRGCEIAGLARCEAEDIDAAGDALRGAENPRIHVFIATSEIHMRHKLRKTEQEVLRDAVRSIEYARKYTDNIEFSPEDATRSDPEFLFKVIEAAIEAGAKVINIPDTTGYTVPTEFAGLIRDIQQRVPHIDRAIVSVHCHNDLGLAVANSLAAIQAGARQVECTVNGIGERAGNTSLEEMVMALRVRKDALGCDTRIVSEEIYPASRLLTSITGVSVQPNKAVVGANAFAHEAGIHQDGVLKHVLTYEIMTPQSIGRSSNELVLGKHSGRHAFRERLHALGFDLQPDQLDNAFGKFKALADKKKIIYNEDLEVLVADAVLRMEDRYRLLSVNVSSGTGTVPVATVEMAIEEREVKDAGFGDGPVDAVFRVIGKITECKAHLIRYQVNAITGGTDAQGEVSVTLSEEGVTSIGQGAHTDIIVASAKAYINALNKLEWRKSQGSARRTEEKGP
ncbi:MAG: 2-isopropylmalate synthase [Deltaproteobacteria bacterium RBG_13_65_10]|nr:MAG: 2-isopropylmalate synthase [Deltaproteobacteria bacterium RBG_13_65_10]